MRKVLDDEILFARLNDSVIIPSKRDEDGAFDVYANFEEDYLIINPNETRLIPTGLVSAFSDRYVAIVKERGSTGSKGMGLRCGVVDSGYRGEWFIAITNHNKLPIVIAKTKYNKEDVNFELCGNTRLSRDYVLYPYEKAIAQVIMVEVPRLKLKEVSEQELMEFTSERGNGMLGSSNK